MSNSENKGVVCGHCHGEGHTECHTCHGNRNEECPTCHGKKEVKCSNCNGHGHYSNCNNCGSTGRVDCKKCGGSGRIRESCPYCHGSGMVTKTRYRNCGECHGQGVIHQDCWKWDQRTQREIHFDKPKDCSRCKGTGQIKESYQETCPTCGGRGKKDHTISCPSCNGRGDFQCSRCHGTGKAECEKCSGTGKLTCSTCSGRGKVVCHDCHGGGDHVCVYCYGTGEKAPSVGSVESSGMDKVNAAIDLVKRKEYVKAFELFREAAVKHSNAVALRRLGRMYERGNAIYKNQKRANILYRLAANAGDIKALYFLGINYVQGLGVDSNRSEARRLLEIATVKGCSNAEEEYKKVADAKLVANAISGVVGWQKALEIPKFLLEADPAADQKDKDQKEAARKAEEARKERERKRQIRNINLCRSLWWWLFRGAAAAVFAFGWTKYSEAWSNGEYAAMLAGGFVLTSFCIRPKFAETGYMLLTIGAIAATYCVADGSIVPWSLALLISLTTLFMRNLGEKMSFPILAYPLMGAAVGFLASPLCCYDTLAKGKAEASIVFEIIAVVVYLYNIGDIHGKGGCVAKGKRTPQIATTLLVLAVLAGAVGFFVYDTRHIQRVVGSDTEKIESRQVVETVKEEQKQQQQLDNLTDFEIGMKYKKGDGVEQNVSKARKYLERAVKKKDRDAEFELGRILIDEGHASEGWQLIKQAADFGHQEANYMLGEKAQNDGKSNEAFHAFFEAARNGHVKSMVKVADYYAEKTGVFGARRDKDKAIEWYKKAAVKGSEDAKKALSEL